MKSCSLTIEMKATKATKQYFFCGAVYNAVLFINT